MYTVKIILSSINIEFINNTIAFIEAFIRIRRVSANGFERIFFTKTLFADERITKNFKEKKRYIRFFGLLKDYNLGIRRAALDKNINCYENCISTQLLLSINY